METISTEIQRTKFQILLKYFIDTYSLDLLMKGEGIKDWRDERAKFYFPKILELSTTLEKIKKYEIYFVEFYPASSKIPTDEVIEYHWHTYVQDFYILQQRIIKIIGSLKNDLQRYKFQNTEEIKKALEHLKKQVVKCLKDASDLRDRYVHETTILSSDLVRAKVLRVVGENSKSLGLDPMAIEKTRTELVESTKKKFIEMARLNSKGMDKLSDFFAPRFGYIFASLNGHNPDVFEM